MFVAAMQFLESRLNPHWLTPVAMEAEALCLARRFKEAHELASLHPDLRIGPKQQTIYELIDGSCKGAPERDATQQDHDYWGILEACFTDQF